MGEQRVRRHMQMTSPAASWATTSVLRRATSLTMASVGPHRRVRSDKDRSPPCIWGESPGGGTHPQRDLSERSSARPAVCALSLPATSEGRSSGPSWGRTSDMSSAITSRWEVSSLPRAGFACQSSKVNQLMVTAFATCTGRQSSDRSLFIRPVVLSDGSGFTTTMPSRTNPLSRLAARIVRVPHQ